MITFNSEYSKLPVHTEYNYDGTIFYVIDSGVMLVIAKVSDE